MIDLQPHRQLRSAISDAFERRRREAVDPPELPALITELAQSMARTGPSLPLQAAPRRVAVAMAMAIHSQPHLAITWGQIPFEGPSLTSLPASWAPEGPLAVRPDAIEEVLQLSVWESDALREEVDRRASLHLKQSRALQWMWTHFGLPEASPWGLFRILFPGLSVRQPDARLLRVGAHLYAIPADMRAPSLASLFLPWVGPDRFAPLTTFQIRSVDRALKHAVSRSIGADGEELDALLGRMVTALPAEALGDFTVLDAWRSRGPATLTQLASGYPSAAWLALPPRDEEVDLIRWMGVREGQLHLSGAPQARFDILATRRVQAMIRQIYAGLLARLHPEFGAGAELGPLDLDLLDLQRHLQAVLHPVIDWPSAPSVHQQVAKRFGLPVEQVAEHLLGLTESWHRHAQRRWFAQAGIYGRLLTHLITLSSSLRRLAQRPPNPQAPHLAPLILFAGHYLAETPLDRLLLPNTPPEDPIGTWFPPHWQALQPHP